MTYEKQGLLTRRLPNGQMSSMPPSSSASANALPSAKSVVIDRNLTLWSPAGRHMSSQRKGQNDKDNDVSGNDERRKLLILFAYMLPQERHLEKYRKMYFLHGFDVLTVKTSPLQFFFPTFGAQKVAANIISWVSRTQAANRYPDVVIHAFSVGGYQFAEFIRALQTASDKTKNALIRSIQGTIFDSPCDVDSVPYGLSRTIAGESFVARVIERFVNMTRRLFYPISGKYHEEGSDTFFNSPLPCPSLFLASKSDKMANISVIEDVVNTWKGKGVDVGLKTWENTRHVGHYHAHPKEYEKDVESFLKKINMA